MQIDGIEIIDAPTEPGDCPRSRMSEGVRRSDETLAAVLRLTVCVLVQVVRVTIVLSLAVGYWLGQALRMALKSLERVDGIRTRSRAGNAEAAAGTASGRHSGASYAHAERKSTLRNPRRPLDPLIPRTLDPFKVRSVRTGRRGEAGKTAFPTSE